jgi:hypothetical protein
MNIFKILASGDGSINEPNVSAFLGYLLNPKADHGLGDELLRKVLNNLYQNNKTSVLKDFLIDKNGEIRNLSSNSNFNIEVLLEQAFSKSQSEKREIVDIVILCFEKKRQPKESLAKIVLSSDTKSRGDLKHLFLLENKIRDDATREGQLIDQCLSTITTLSNVLNEEQEKIKEKLSIIFIHPDAEKSNLEFSQLQKDTSTNIPKLQIHWSKSSDEDDVDDADLNSLEEASMSSYLQQILVEEAEGIIEPINEQTKFTLKSFVRFINSNFKSTIEEELEGKYKKQISLDYDEFKEQHSDLLTENSWLLADSFYQLIKAEDRKFKFRHSPTHPISVFVNNSDGVKSVHGNKIFSLTRANKNICLELIHRTKNWTKEKNQELYSFISTYQVNINDTAFKGVIILTLQNPNIKDIQAIFNKFYHLLGS